MSLKKPNQRMVGVNLENNCLQGEKEKMTTHVTDVRVQDEADSLAKLITPRASSYC